MYITENKLEHQAALLKKFMNYTISDAIKRINHTVDKCK